MTSFICSSLYLMVTIRLNPSLPIADQLAVRNRVIARVNTALADHMLAWLPEDVTSTAAPDRWQYHIPLHVYAVTPPDRPWSDILADLQDEGLSVQRVATGVFVDTYQTEVLTAFTDALEAFTATLRRSNNDMEVGDV